MFRTTRTPTTTAGSVALTAVLVLTLVGCQSDDPGASQTTAIATADTPTATPTFTERETTPEEEAADAAEDVLRSYYTLADQSLQDPVNFDPKKFEDVAYGTALTDLYENFYGISGQGFVQIGNISLESVESTVVDLTDNQDGSPPLVPIVEFQVCYDVTNLDLVDAKGESVVSPDRMLRSVERVGVVNYSYPEGPWQVLFVENLEETC